jgi:signal transduction histidine kinase
VRDQLARLRQEVALSLDELRDVARGIHPAVVTGHGLTVALESVAERTPLPLELAVADLPRLPEAIEVTAYYVVCEGLANVGKHARATRCVVDVRLAGELLVVAVTDDGAGGADPARARACAASPTAWRPSTAGSTSRPCPPAARACGRRSRCRTT